MIEITLIIVLILAVVFSPFWIYLSVKLGRYAFLQATELFEREHPHSQEHEEFRNGQSKVQDRNP